MHYFKSFIRLFCLITFFTNYSFSQAAETDTINLTYSQGKDILINQSLRAISDFYNINIAEAELQQRRLWNNPTFVWNADMYSVEKNTYFQFTNQKLIQLEYIFSVSGKRIKAIKQAKLGIEIAKLAYADVLRGLILEYSNAFSNLYILNEKGKIYDTSVSNYRTFIQSFEKQLELGMISENDLIRLRSEYITIWSEATDNNNKILAEQSNLNSLLNLPPSTIIIPGERPLLNLNVLQYPSVLANAQDNRPDYKIAQKNINYYEQELKIQKANAVPDIKFGYQPHDKGSNYVRPYQGIVLEMGIPIFNRNQGEISKSRIKIEQSKIDLEYFNNKMENDIFSSFHRYNNTKINLQRYYTLFMEKVEELVTDANINFRKKNISILQYIDYQRTFLNTKLQYNETLNEYLNAVNELNFVVGKEITN